MSDIEGVIDQIEQLLKTGKQDEPHELLTEVLETMGSDELQTWRHDLHRLIQEFMPKRRRALDELFANQLNPRPKNDEIRKTTSQDTPRPIGPSGSDLTVRAALANLEASLERLASFHIFQWSTFYRDCIADQTQALQKIGTLLTPEAIDQVAHIVTEHAKTIFTKGYEYQRGKLNHDVRKEKTLAGLERFLELPIDTHLQLLSGSSRDQAVCLRNITSATLLGILQGYAELKLDQDTGAALLPVRVRSWASSLGFLTEPHARTLSECLKPGDFREGMISTFLPLAAGIDSLIAKTDDYFPGPILCEFKWDRRRLDITLEEPPDASEPIRIVLNCIFNDQFLGVEDLDEADRTGVALVVTALRADLEHYVHNKNWQFTRVLTIAPEEHRSANVRILHALEEIVFQRRSKRGHATPFSYNFAREFPLRDAKRRRYFHVPRTSVRDLLKVFERRNGIRLWCSVRRSGKTTACFDLTSTENKSVVVSQTCDSTDPHTGGNVFFDGVVDALERGEQLPQIFVNDLVRKAADRDADRFVLVIDEYETLFNRLRVALNRDRDVRYLVIQPLLNQLVSFSHENLLVFLGQQPDVHYIMMDQNQLSAYVQQDPFPLFQHIPNTTVGEFSELLRKVFGTRASFDSGFADSVFAETAGHPYLTVNVLVELVDWLIETKRPRQNLRLGSDDFGEFALKRLSSRGVRLSGEFEFFRQAIGEAFGPYGKREAPWLFAAYGLLKRLGREGLEEWVDLEQATLMVANQKLPSISANPESFIRSLVNANFLTVEGKRVRCRIRLLGRICVATSRSGKT